MKRLNNKGYMLVEIIVASVIAFSVAYYLLNLTYKFKDKNEDIYYSTVMLADKINITKNIIDDLEKYTINSVDVLKNQDGSGGTKINFNVKSSDGSDTVSVLKIEKNEIQYSSSSSSYKKEISSGYEISKVSVDSLDDSNYCFIVIKVSSLYTKNNEDIKLLVNKNGKNMNGDFSGHIVKLYFNTGLSNPSFKVTPSSSITVNSEGKILSSDNFVLPKIAGKNFLGYYLFNDEGNKFIPSYSNDNDSIKLDPNLSYSDGFSLDPDTGELCLTKSQSSSTTSRYTCGNKNAKSSNNSEPICCSGNYIYEVSDDEDSETIQKIESKANISDNMVIDSSGNVSDPSKLKEANALIAKWE